MPIVTRHFRFSREFLFAAAIASAAAGPLAVNAVGDCPSTANVILQATTNNDIILTNDGGTDASCSTITHGGSITWKVKQINGHTAHMFVVFRHNHSPFAWETNSGTDGVPIQGTEIQNHDGDYHYSVLIWDDTDPSSAFFENVATEIIVGGGGCPAADDNANPIVLHPNSQSNSLDAPLCNHIPRNLAVSVEWKVNQISGAQPGNTHFWVFFDHSKPLSTSSPIIHGTDLSGAVATDQQNQHDTYPYEVVVWDATVGAGGATKPPLYEDPSIIVGNGHTTLSIKEKLEELLISKSKLHELLDILGFLLIVGLTGFIVISRRSRG